jgi:hypothetical protein
MKTPYRDRAEGSTSKLNTYKDGARILVVIVNLIKQERPLLLFFILSVLLFLLAVILGVPLFIEYRHTHLVPRLPTAVLCAAIMMLSFLALVCGLILDSVSRGRKEVKRLAYLSMKSNGTYPRQVRSDLGA